MATADWLLIAVLLFVLLVMIRLWRERSRVNRNRLWLLSLGQAQLILLVTKSIAGLDQQDYDGLVQLAYNSYPEGQKDVIVQRIAEHLIEPLAL